MIYVTVEVKHPEHPVRRLCVWTMPAWKDCGIELSDGHLTIWDYSQRKSGGAGVVAAYAPGVWASVCGIERDEIK